MTSRRGVRSVRGARWRLPLLLGLGLACGLLPGCALHRPWHWPWKARAPQQPVPVQVVDVQPADADAGQIAPVQNAPAPITQYWDGTALLLDLSAQAGEGGVTLHPPADGRWPVRMEFRVQPGRMARLEVRAGERTQFEVPAQGAPVVLHLRLDGYRGESPQITLRWYGAGDSAR